MKVKIMSTKSRNYFLDNYKALLILLVVMGHFIEPCHTNNPVLESLKWIIFSFHMPAFIFISGFFSKRAMSLEKLIQKLVIPYFVYELLYYFLYVFVIHKETGLYLNRPKFSLWYLMALFFWRIITPYFQKIPGNMAIAFTAGLLIGYTQLGNFFSIPRTCSFTRFSWQATYFRKTGLNPAPSLEGFYPQPDSLCVLFPRHCIPDRYRTDHLYFLRTLFLRRYGYAGNGKVCWYGQAAIVISFLMFFALSAVIPRKRYFFSVLGVRTMPIYLFHGLLYSVLKATPLLENVDTYTETVLLLSSCVGITFLLACDRPNRFVNRISSFPVRLPKLPKLPGPPALRGGQLPFFRSKGRMAR